MLEGAWDKLKNALKYPDLKIDYSQYKGFFDVMSKDGLVKLKNSPQISKHPEFVKMIDAEIEKRP